MRSGQTELKVDVEQLESGPCVVSVAGEIDMYTAPELERQLLGVARNGATALILDLTDCEFLDSTALRVVVKADRQSEGSARPLLLVTVDQRIRKVFEITGLDRVFPIYPSRAAALTASVASRRT